MSGTQALITLAERAVASGDPEQIVNSLRDGLCELISSGEMICPTRHGLLC